MDVEFKPNVPIPIKTSGIEIAVTNTKGQGGNLRGRLVVSNTRLVWWPAGVQLEKNTKRISWDRFIKLMEDM